MIHGKTKSTIEMLHESPHTFFLTGSRFFGTARENSDYDLMCYDTSEIRSFLVSLGFKSVNENYKDSSIAEVLRKDDIDIQLIKAGLLAEKLWLQEAMAKHGIHLLLKRLSKSEARVFWDFCFVVMKG